MNKNVIESYSASFINVMPQLGLSNLNFIGVEDFGRKIITPGVIVIIGVVGDLHGNVIFAMSEDIAKTIASTMMGMPVDAFDDMAQSAVSELSNMLAANACIELSGRGITADISTPTLMYGDFTANSSFENCSRIEMSLEGLPFYIYVSLE